MDRFTLAIEMGGSNTVIYKLGDGVVLKEATVMAVESLGNKNRVVAVGDTVKKMSVLPDNVRVMHPVENGVITDMELAGIMLKKFLEKIEEYKFFKKPGILFLVPCGLSVEEKNVYRNMAYLLGISHVEVMPSVVATMMGLNINYNDDKSYIIANIGANTDIAIINNGKIVDGCTIDVGGASIDGKIKNYIHTKKDIDMDEFAVEGVKIDIGTLLPNDIRSIKISGNDSMGDYIEAYIDSTEIYEILKKEYAYIVEAMANLLSKCNSNSINNIVMQGIYLCGASSKMTGIVEYFENKLNIVPVIHAKNPEATTIIGAGNLLNNSLLLYELLLLNRTDGE
ncbi:MAG: rod shape-determining protein [Clostridia bacterium]|nr:rod shape-determining protein [Clostridia bacterium]